MTEKSTPADEDEFGAAFEEFGTQQKPEEPGQAPGSSVMEGGDGEPPAATPAAAAEPAAPATPAAPAEGAAAPAAPAAAQPADDLWASAPEELRNQFQQLREDNARLQRRAVSDSGRIRALNDRLKQGAAAPAASPAAVPTAQQVEEAARTPGGLAQLKEDYPEVAAAFETELAAVTQGLRKEMDQLRSSVAAPQQFVQEFDQATRDAAVEAAHQGWKQTVATPEFAAWLDSQPEFIQTATTSENPADAIGLLNLFRASRPAAPQPQTQTQEPASAKPNERVMRAASLPTRRASAPTPLPPDDFDAAFDHYAKR